MGAQQSQEDGAAASSADDGLSQWRVPTDERRRLPAMHPSAVASSSALLVAIAGVVYDLTSFADDHPGGREVLDAHRGQDATEAFIEAVHPYGAVWPQMKDMRVGVLREEGDDEGQQKEVAATKAEATSSVGDSQVSGSRHRRRCRVLYGTQTGSARNYAEAIARHIQQRPELSCALSVRVEAMEAVDPEDLSSEELLLLVVATYTDGQPPAQAKFFCDWLSEAASDFRVGDSFLERVAVACFGCGNSLYDQHFNAVAQRLSAACEALGAARLCADGVADDSVSRTTPGVAADDFAHWRDHHLTPALLRVVTQPDAFQADADSQRRERRAHLQSLKEREEKEADDKAPPSPSPEEDVDADDPQPSRAAPSKVVDLEELGQTIHKGGGLPVSKARAERKEEAVSTVRIHSRVAEGAPVVAPRPMLTAALRGALGKQGYKLIGSHSGVKLCRWTKAMLRGRGGCYKHSFYGINSSQCMEMTPSLACANKCVFCWRHGTNPVGKTWTWDVDRPELILEGALEQHRRMVAQMKGVPGVKPERFAEALVPKHCALSLVGEPIMYPHINQYLRLLHARGISTFLVTNSQFPDRVQQLEPITQLYLSIDAATAASLKSIDRPLFSDYWPRFLSCLRALREKRQRTVYRLTLVKAHNMEEVLEYASLVAIGRPTLIEVKGVTFCGDTSAANDLAMANVPFHSEVKAFTAALCKAIGELGAEEGGVGKAERYELACEHEHSCCVLIASTRLKRKEDGRWMTWIDYERYRECIARYYESEGKEGFGVEDYWAETPGWALYDSKEAGFNPSEERFTKAKRTREQAEEVSKAREMALNG